MPEMRWMKKSILLVLISGLLQPLCAQVKWPVVTNVSKPWTRWWWLGSEVAPSDLTTVMRQYQQAGLGGLEITPIYGVQKEEQLYIPFLTEQWMDIFAHTLQEGKKLGLGIDVANATGWPFGGPWIGDEDACKNMVYKTWLLHAGESLNETIEYIQEPLVRTENNKRVNVEDLVQPVAANKNQQAMAIDQVRFRRPLPLQTLMAYDSKGASVELTGKVDAQGKLHWTAPVGDWTLYALFMGWHGKQVERAAPGGEGNVIDHFSAGALQHYLARFDTAFKNFDLSALRGFFNDSYEVDDAQGQSNYTPLLFEEFQKRRGYDLKMQLPALFAKVQTETTNRILCDYRMTIDELILEKFTKQWADWAHSKGKIVRNQSHGSPANTLDLYSAVDIPEIEGTEILRIKFASSAAHVTGKPLASAEAATWLNEHFISTLSDVKKALDVYFAGGVNHIVYHGTSYSPPAEPWPGRLFYASVEFTQANPFWNHFSALNQYVARVQSFLQQGRPDNDVLLYFPIYDKYAAGGKDLLLHFDGMKPGFHGSSFEGAAQLMQEKGYAFDYVSDRQIEKLQTSGKQLVASGASYKTILLPDCRFMKPETLQKLLSLAEQGATVIVWKQLPADVPGYGALDKNQQALQALISKLQFANDKDGVRWATVGKGQVLVGNNLQQLLQGAAVKPEALAEKGFDFHRRRNEDGSTVYFIANKSNAKWEGWLPLRIKGEGVALYNPMSGVAGIAQTRKDADGNLEVYLPFNTDESYVIQVAEKPLSGNSYPYNKPGGITQEINGEWILTFTEGGPALPASVTLPHLKAWTELDGAYKTFSGTAVYRTSFRKPETHASRLLLSLGKVYESAQVLINGKAIATLIGPDFQVPVMVSDLKTDNVLEIKVANSMANRIIDLDKRGVVWKKFNNTNFPARLAQNRGADNLFDASHWEPRISGLVGPVIFTELP